MSLTNILNISVSEGHFQGSEGQGDLDCSIQAITQDFPGMHVHDHSQVDKIREDSDVGDIGQPDLVDGGSHQVPNQVGKDRIGVTAVCRSDPFLSWTA